MTPFRFLRPLCLRHRLQSQPSRTYANSPADQPDFVSVLDRPPTLVRAGKKRHGPGLLFLAAIPITAFALGCWQIQRLFWKTDLITKFSDQLARPPLSLPPHVDTSRLSEFEYRRVLATGHFRHDQEMLIGPRLRDGENGFQVVTPLERPNGTKVLVNRGWIRKDKKMHRDRGPGALPDGVVHVMGLLRSPWKKNAFTPNNRPDLGEFYFPDVHGMAKLVGAQPVWMEETMEPDLVTAIEMEANGTPLGRPPEVNLRNNHMQYIVTWFGLSAATTVMFYLLVRKPPPDVARRVRSSTEWS